MHADALFITFVDGRKWLVLKFGQDQGKMVKV